MSWVNHYLEPVGMPVHDLTDLALHMSVKGLDCFNLLYVRLMRLCCKIDRLSQYHEFKHFRFVSWGTVASLWTCQGAF